MSGADGSDEVAVYSAERNVQMGTSESICFLMESVRSHLVFRLYQKANQRGGCQVSSKTVFDNEEV